MANELDIDLNVSEFEPKSRYYIHFWTNALWEKYKPPYPQSSWLNSITAVL